MTTSQSIFGLQAISAGFERQRAIETVARYKRALQIHINEEQNLRIALALAEALLAERRIPIVPPQQSQEQAKAATCAATLTPRQHEIMELVLSGRPSKIIAADLGISRRTVENHRAAIMKKTGSKSLPALGVFGFVVHGA